LKLCLVQEKDVLLLSFIAYLSWAMPLISYVVSVPKKNFPRAVDRNKVKRLIREVLRKNLDAFGGVGFGKFMFIYSSNKIVSFLDIEKDFKSLIKKAV